MLTSLDVTRDQKWEAKGDTITSGSLFATAALKISDSPDRSLLEKFQGASGAINLYF